MGFNAKATLRWEAISIDFHKAFNTLQWDVIGISLEVLEFDDTFHKLIQACLQSIYLSTLMEDSPTMLIQASRSV